MVAAGGGGAGGGGGSGGGSARAPRRCSAPGAAEAAGAAAIGSASAAPPPPAPLTLGIPRRQQHPALPPLLKIRACHSSPPQNLKAAPTAPTKKSSVWHCSPKCRSPLMQGGTSRPQIKMRHFPAAPSPVSAPQTGLWHPLKTTTEGAPPAPREGQCPVVGCHPCAPTGSGYRPCQCHRGTQSVPHLREPTQQ